MWKRILTSLPFAILIILIICFDVKGAPAWIGFGIAVLLATGLACITDLSEEAEGRIKKSEKESS